MIGEGGAVIALGQLVQLDFVILDVGGLELLGDALLHVARGLADLEQAHVRRVGNRVGVDARTRRRFRRQDFFDGFTHRFRPRPSGEPFG